MRDQVLSGLDTTAETEKGQSEMTSDQNCPKVYPTNMTVCLGKVLCTFSKRTLPPRSLYLYLSFSYASDHILWEILH